MLVVNNAFVYIHQPKTGGTFVTEMLRKIAASSHSLCIQEVQVPKHSGVRKIPAEFKGLPVAINVRNVFEHYVSRYTFRWWADPQHAQNMFVLDKVLKAYPHFPELSFSEFLRLFNQWDLRLNETPNRVQVLTQNEIGFNSRELVRLSTQDPLQVLQSFDAWGDATLQDFFQGIHFLRTEHLNSELYELLKAYGVQEQELSPLLEAEPILPKKGGRGQKRLTWTEYFCPGDIDFVQKRDRIYFRLFPDMLPD